MSFCVVPLKSILFFEKGHSQLKFHKKFYKTLGSRPLFRDFLFAKFHSLKTRFHRIAHFAILIILQVLEMVWSFSLHNWSWKGIFTLILVRTGSDCKAYCKCSFSCFCSSSGKITLPSPLWVFVLRKFLLPNMSTMSVYLTKRVVPNMQ